MPPQFMAAVDGCANKFYQIIIFLSLFVWERSVELACIDWIGGTIVNNDDLRRLEHFIHTGITLDAVKQLPSNRVHYRSVAKQIDHVVISTFPGFFGIKLHFHL